MNPSSSAMIRSLFINKQALEKGANRPDAPDQKVKKLGVIGAGMMGAGIAYVAAQAGHRGGADRPRPGGGRQGQGAGREPARRGREAQARHRGRRWPRSSRRITATPDYAALAGCDLVVEAVFEDPGVKAETTQRAEAHLGPDAIFATNTSTLPIGELAKASRDAANFIGIHFFSPVRQDDTSSRSSAARETGDRAVAKALDFVRQIRKTPIVVNDARFFYANRCIIPYINEGVRMVAEGVEPALIENAAKQLGMPLGPLQLVDETSIDLGVKIAKATQGGDGRRLSRRARRTTCCSRSPTRAGWGARRRPASTPTTTRASGTGLWPELRDHWPPRGDQPDLTEVQHRLAMIQTLEAVRALEEGVLTDIREGDVGAILGWGFMPWSGGPFSWLDILGAAQARARSATSSTPSTATASPPPALLREMAAKGESFYGRAEAAAAA